MKPKDFTVGQHLVFADTRRRGVDVKTVVVTKVGREWVYTSNQERFAPPDMQADGGHYISAGRYYLSMDEYEDERDKSIAWSELRAELGRMYATPIHLTTEQISAIRSMLRKP